MGWPSGRTDCENSKQGIRQLKVRILYLSQYFPPEVGATQTRAFEMARGLVKAGHQVTVITEFPNHPSGIMPESYRRRVFERTKLDGIDVIRVWVKASPVKTFNSRLAFYLSFMVMSFIAGLIFARRRYDAIYATSPPLFVGGAALMLSYLRRTPLFFEVRDLWPEVAVQMNQLSNARAIRWSTWLEESCYRRALRIIVVTRGIKARLVSRGIPEEKITIIPNGANVELYTARARNGKLQREIGLEPHHFVLIYTGLLGLIHGLETVIETAELLKDQEEIRFLLVGDGPRKAFLKNMCEERSIQNVIFHDAVPEIALADYIALSDVGLHVQRALEIARMALPVKMFSYMACEKPVLMALEGEGADLMEASKAGIVVPPEDPPALVEAIRFMQSHPERCLEYGRNGRSTVEKYYSRQALAREMAELIQEGIQNQA